MSRYTNKATANPTKTRFERAEAANENLCSLYDTAM